MSKEWVTPTEWFDWYEPVRILAETSTALAHTPSDRLFNAPEFKALREAWVAARFTAHLGFDPRCRVRLIAGQFPDFEVLQGNESHSFEIVEADTPGRKRGQEYRELAAAFARGEAPALEHVDVAAETLTAIEAAVAAIDRKASKHYSVRTNLLVYVNFWSPSDVKQAALDLVARIEASREAFKAIWLLWGDEVIRCWPNPVRLRERTEGGPCRPDEVRGQGC